MQLRLVLAALAALVLALGGTAFAQTPDARDSEPKPPPPAKPEPKNVITPINSFADAAGAWSGWIDLYTRVVMVVGYDGVVKFQGPRDITKQAIIEDQRLVLDDSRVDLDCGITNERLACHARFGRMWAELNLTKVVASTRRGW
jgi:hypothetical protein